MAEIISLDKKRQNLRQKPTLTPSPEIVAAIEKYFAENEYTLKKGETPGIFRAAFTLNCKLKSIEVIIAIEESNLTVHFILPIGAGRDFEDQIRVAEFLTRANYYMINGCFELDFSDGEIQFRADFHDRKNLAPSSQAIDYLLMLGIAMCNMYGDALLKVIFDAANPEEAIKEAEKRG